MTTKKQPQSYPKPAIYTLIDAVRVAIAAYDADPDDHISHGAGADCVRCKLATIVDPKLNGKVPAFRRPRSKS
jgi:hypothetical protein